jgi:hypothetical protein
MLLACPANACRNPLCGPVSLAGSRMVAHTQVGARDVLAPGPRGTERTRFGAPDTLPTLLAVPSSSKSSFRSRSTEEDTMRGKTDNELERLCDACGAAAVYELRGDDLCGDCACWRSAVLHGELCAAHEVLGYAVAQLRGAGLTDDAVRRALEATLTRPEVEPEYSVAYSEIGPESAKGRWLQNATGLVEASLPSGAGA